MLTSIRSVKPVLRREFFEIDGRGDADRQAQYQRHQQREERAESAPRMPASSGSRESPGVKKRQAMPRSATFALRSDSSQKASRSSTRRFASGTLKRKMSHAPSARWIERSRRLRCLRFYRGRDFRETEPAAIHADDITRNQSARTRLQDEPFAICLT